ncbi:flagellar hook-associated protein FlgK [Sporobacter termitidis DSM 10068]|uniref:Flagellar hook-associated protein 1 n=2 Tax=Sporobacter TaxID=44748 RepID=A0A1M5W6M0_9FIRM|nr:flagellar hook-associated protein FlgK [Sporobacter termitidis DSM 10068]
MQQLNVTEQNISNVNTLGYTRQRVLTSAKEPTSPAYLVAQLSKAAVGQGVEATGVQQIRSAYLDQQYRNLNTNYGYSAARSDALAYMDGLFNELDDDSSMKTSIKDFFAALNKFASDTTSKEYRTAVQKQAESMTESFRNVYEEMQSLWQDQNSSIHTASEQINSLAQKIANLNDAIARSEQNGATANDLNDERNLLLDELSGYVNITYTPNAKNSSMVDVSIGGIALVEGRNANTVNTWTMSDMAAQAAAINSDATLPTAADKQAAIQAIVDQMNAHTAPGTVTMQLNADDPTQWDILYDGKTVVEGTTALSAEDAAGGDVDMLSFLSRNRLTLVNSTTAASYELDIGSGGAITGGQLYSNIEMISNSSSENPGIPYYMNQMNELVREIAKNINDIHLQGYTYPDGSNGNTSVKGIMFFQANPVPVDADGDGTQDVDADGNLLFDYTHAYDNVTAGNFSISDAVRESVYNIAGSELKIDLSAGSTNAGNAGIAEKLAKDLTNSGYNDKLNSIVDNLAITSKTSDSIASTKGSLLDNVNTQRKSVSSVSLDEETTNLIVFQQSYNAAARIITTLDDMLDTMINKMGIN